MAGLKEKKTHGAGRHRIRGEGDGHNTMSENRDLRAAKDGAGRDRIVLAGLIGACCLCEMLMLLNFFPRSNHWTFGFRMAEVFLIGAAGARVDLKKNKWILLCWAALLLVFLTSALRGKAVMDATKKPLGRGLLAYGLCPCVGLLLSEKQVRSFLRGFAAVWTAFFCALSCVGIWCVANGITIKLKGVSWVIGMAPYNSQLDALRLGAHNNYTGAFLAASVTVALLGALLYRKKTVRILFLLACLPMTLCLSMTLCRTGMAVAAAGIAMTAVSLLQPRLSRGISKKAVRVLVSLALIAIILVPAALGIIYSANLYNRAVSGKGILLSRAQAESVTATEAKPAGEMDLIYKNNTGLLFSGREYGWKAALGLLRERPVLLLTGTSVPLVMRDIRTESGEELSHLHCMPLQILMETGIWGLLTAGWLFLLFVRAAWRLFFDGQVEAWKRAVMIPAAMMLLTGLVEGFTRLSDYNTHALVIQMLFGGLTIALGKKENMGNQST